jgi:hypothetical protein
MWHSRPRLWLLIFRSPDLRGVPLPRSSQVGVGFRGYHPRPSQIGADFSDLFSIGVGFRDIPLWPLVSSVVKVFEFSG